jgi:RNA-directed DNA polymerase
LGNLETPESIQRLQTALHVKAKEEPEYRFYLLYDKIYRLDVLNHAYRSCKANKGSAGVDGVRFEDIEAYGEVRWLGELAERLKRKDYRPEAVKRVWIPKPNGKLRPLGIPMIADRVVQTAAMIVLEPYSKRIYNRSNTLTGRTAERRTRYAQCTGYSSPGIGMWSMRICRAILTRFRIQS